MTQSFPSTPSTWSLATTTKDVDGDTELRPDPYRQDELNDLAARNGKSSLQPEDKPSLFKRVIRKAGKIMKSKLVLAL